MKARPLCVLLLVVGCSGPQGMIGDAGADAERFGGLFELFLAVCGIAYLLVLGFLLLALMRRGGEGPFKFVVIGWLAFIVIGLTTLTLASFLTDRKAAAAEQRGADLTLTVTAHQWWWDVKYEGATPSEQVRTANEIHLPAGKSVRINLKSDDVIHSFWIPSLAGKQDMIPGRDVDIFLEPRTPGLFRAQCAEYCGAQHAHMALDIIVHSPVSFEAWRRRQLTPAVMPASALARQGYGYFTSRECGSCHAVAGTPASAQVAPDLTHFASRRSIAAGTFPMTRGHIYAWLADPQGAKPGNAMPRIDLAAADLHALAAYLETLR